MIMLSVKLWGLTYEALLCLGHHRISSTLIHTKVAFSE